MFNFAVGKVELISALVAKIAQVVEHFPRNEKVAGSSPAFGSKSKSRGLFSGLALLILQIPNPRPLKPSFSKEGLGGL